MTIPQKIIKLSNWLLDIIFPRRCLGCGHEGSYVCSNCFSSLSVLVGTACYICGKRSSSGKICTACQAKKSSALDGLLVASDWESALLREMIYAFKYRFVKELSEPLTKLMIEFLERNEILKTFKNNEIILVPVPLHKKRLAWRGFNQSEILAKILSAHFSLPILPVLKRSRYNTPQAEIKSRAKRQENVKDSFKNIAAKDQLKDKIVILIDDVSTTSSTLLECAGALKPHKPKEIWGLVIARG